MYQIFYDKAGVKQHQMNHWSFIQYWNDACFHRCIPENTTGMTYLDIGSHAGLFPLRFEQRGGTSAGTDYSLAKIIDSASEVPTTGQIHQHPEYEWVKKEYGAKYPLYVGGFDEDGSLVPDLGKFNIISTMNVLEYLPNPQKCVQKLFLSATDRVILNLDISPDGPTRASNLSPMKWVVGLQDLISWCPWPTTHWLLNIGEKSDSEWQVFLVATNPESKLAPVSPDPIVYDLECSETEKFWRKNPINI